LIRGRLLDSLGHYRPVSRTVMNFSVVIIAFNPVMMANAPYTQSCFVNAAQVNIAVIIKNVIAMLRYHWGDELMRCCCSCSCILLHKTSWIKIFNHKGHEGSRSTSITQLPNYPITKSLGLPNHSDYHQAPNYSAKLPNYQITQLPISS
jgi:hypothetical protein